MFVLYTRKLIRQVLTNTTIKGLTLIILFFLGIRVGFCQKKEFDKDSISKLSYVALSKYFNLDKTKTFFALTYLEKAKNENDIDNILEGYIMMTNTGDHHSRISYNDSLIKLAAKNHKYHYLNKGYIKKAQFLGFKNNFSASLEMLIIANKYATKQNDVSQIMQIKYMIGLLHLQLGEYVEGIEEFKKIDKYYDSIQHQKEYIPYDHINAVYGLAYGYILLKEYNSADHSNKKGIRLSFKYDDDSFYPDLLVTSGMTHYYRKEYQSSLDSIFKFKKIKHQFKNRYAIEIVSELYLGHIQYDYSKLIQAEKHYQKVDSLVFSKEYFHPEIRSAYEKLIKISRINDDKERQLYYMDRLLHLDSILSKDYHKIFSTLNKKYTTPLLLKEKQKIIQSVEKRYSNIVFVSVVSIMLLGMALLYFYNNHRKNKIYKKRFEALMKENEKDKQSNQVSKGNYSLDLSDEIETELLRKLEVFEGSQGYLSHGISINDLCKKLDTNSRYLSMVINKQKEKSFQNYINELRINYAIDKLKSEEKFRKFTISAIANECGFNTPQAFSISFKKVAGLAPSYFLKSLNT